MSTETKKKNPPPVAKFQIRRVQTAIWPKSSEKGAFFEASFETGYKNKEGKWVRKHSFDLDGLLALQYAVPRAIDQILALRAADISDTAEAPEVVDEQDEVPF